MPRTHASTARSVAFVLAHQDDECALATRITRELDWGSRVHCVFLTDGSAGGVEPSIRDAESRAVLTGLGVRGTDIHFVGSSHRLPDGSLPEHLERALALTRTALDPFSVRRVYTLAYEGGHQDHDAAHLVALAFAARAGLLLRTWEAAFYNGWRTPAWAFRVYRPVPAARPNLRRRLGLHEALRSTLLAARYPSQRRTWAGLFAEHALRRGLLRQELLRAVDTRRAGRRPHDGRLLYESRFAYPHERFARYAAPFVARHLDDARPALDS